MIYYLQLSASRLIDTAQPHWATSHFDTQVKSALSYRLAPLQHILSLHSALGSTSLQHGLMSFNWVYVVFLFSVHIYRYNSSMHHLLPTVPSKCDLYVVQLNPIESTIGQRDRYLCVVTALTAKKKKKKKKKTFQVLNMWIGSWVTPMTGHFFQTLTPMQKWCTIQM